MIDAHDWPAERPIRSRLFRLMCFVGLLASADVSAQAWGGAFGVASDNVYRGISYSDGHPSWLAEIHYEFSPAWVGGIAVNTVRLPTQSTDAQFTLFFDRRWRLTDDWTTKLGYVHYDSVDPKNQAALRYDEVNAEIGYRGQWRAALAWSPKAGSAYAGGIDAGTYVPSAWLWLETAWRQPLWGRLSADAGIGYARSSGTGPHDYRYASIGVNYALRNVYFNASRLWTSSLVWNYSLFGFPYEVSLPSEKRWVGSVVWSF